MKKTLLILSLLLVVLLSCKKNQEEVLPLEKAPEKLESIPVKDLLNFISASMQVNVSEISYNEKDSVFTIQKDMLISFKDACARFIDQKKNQNTPTVQHYFGSFFVHSNYISNIKVYIRAGVPQDWRTAIHEAISNWNNTLTRVRFVFSSYADADIRINGDNDGGNGTVASAYLPGMFFTPGSEININYHYSTLSASQKVFAITHELGHTIGFKHTDQTDGNYINGTPTSDPNSVMNSTVLSWSGFTSGDITAVNIVYPYTTIYNSVAWTTYRAYPKTDCGPGYVGTAHTYTISAGAAQSVISQEEADSRARTIADQYGFTNANLVGSCVMEMIGGINRMWWSDQETYTFYHKPPGSTVTWTVTAPLRIVGSNTGDTVVVEHDPAYPILENNTYGEATITGTVGTTEYHRNIQIKYE